MTVVMLGLAGVASAAGPVSVFPTPGSKSSMPGTQIVFRGVPAAAIGPVAVTGSRTGLHTGQIAADSDGQGASFLPDKPFAAGKTVTVTTGLNVLGGRDGSFQFTVARPFGTITPERIPLVAAGANGLQRFRSRPDLVPPSITVTSRGDGSNTNPGELGLKNDSLSGTWSSACHSNRTRPVLMSIFWTTESISGLPTPGQCTGDAAMMYA